MLNPCVSQELRQILESLNQDVAFVMIASSGHGPWLTTREIEGRNVISVNELPFQVICEVSILVI